MSTHRLREHVKNNLDYRETLYEELYVTSNEFVGSGLCVNHDIVVQNTVDGPHWNPP